MAKKVKKKGRSGQKDKRVVAASQKSSAPVSSPSIQTVDAVVPAVKGRRVCPHFDKGFNLDKVCSKLGSLVTLKCEDCREESVDRRAGKAKGKHGKKKGGSGDSKLAAKAIWVCLECGHFSCGGAGFPTIPQTHAVRHARQSGHHLAIQFKNPHLRWCFPCSTLIPVDNSEENGQLKDVLFDIVKVIKARPSEVASVDVEDVWFGGGSVKSEIISENYAPGNFDWVGGHVVRGLLNLGNTCYFNSILQNLMAMDRLRDHLLKVDGSVGQLTVSLKKLFVETNPETGYKGVMSPKSVLGCLATKSSQFQGFEQHDSHELLRCLLDGLSSEELDFRKLTNSSMGEGMSPNQDPTFVDAIFGGVTSSTVTCLECGYSSIVNEPFLDLSLPIPTKRPASNKFQPVTRPKKPKLPPRRSQRIRSKFNGNTDHLPSHSLTDSSNSEQTSFQVQSTERVANNMMVSSINISSESVDGAGGTNSASLNLPTTEVVDNSLLCKSVLEKPISVKPLTAVDDTAWLDILGLDTVLNDGDMAAESNFTQVTEDTGNDNAYNDALLQNPLEFSRQDPFPREEHRAPGDTCMTQMDYLEPAILSDNPGVALQDNDTSGDLDFTTKDTGLRSDFLRHSSETGNQVLSKVPNLEMALKGNSWEDELPLRVQSSGVLLLTYKEDTGANGDRVGMEFGKSSWEDETRIQVQSSEVLLLPYKEDASTNGEAFNRENGVTTSPVGHEQESADFEGFGDLFNEPEAAAEPALKPLNDKLPESSEVVGTGIIGNSSGSDLDEIDNSDSPVSVEKCLSYFTKLELLSKIEHAWQCENCSKALAEQRKSKKNLQKSKSNVSLEGGEGSKYFGPIGSMNLGKENNEDVIDTSAERFVSCNGNTDRNLNCTFEKNQKAEEQHGVTPALEEGKGEIDDALLKVECNMDSSNDCCSVNDFVTARCNPNKLPQTESKSIDGEHESEGGEDEELDSESVKVKRDARKKILIDKAPPILTIHLKRFSQDARGRVSKLNGHVVFRDSIDLTPYMHHRCAERENFKYRLLGVVVHSGSMKQGHYVAYVRGGAKKSGEEAEKENADSIWYYTSDAIVREVSFEQVLRCEAYILFYEQV